MLGDDKPDLDDRILLRLYRGREAAELAARALPPTPVRLVTDEGAFRWSPVTVFRGEWRQLPFAVFRAPDRSTEGMLHTEADLAREIDDTENPIRALINALEDVDAALQDGHLIPLGVTLSTRHEAEGYPYRDRRGAVVSIDVTTVSEHDVRRVLGEDREEGMATGADA